MEKYEDDEEKRFFDLRECFWFCMTSLTPQGGGEAPKNVSGRLVAGSFVASLDFGFVVVVCRFVDKFFWSICRQNLVRQNRQNR